MESCLKQASCSTTLLAQQAPLSTDHDCLSMFLTFRKIVLFSYIRLKLLIRTIITAIPYPHTFEFDE